MSEEQQSAPPDVEAIMARIRSQVRSELEKSGRKTDRYLPPSPQAFEGKSSPILYSDELNYLNAHWADWLQGGEFSSHRPLLGRFIIKAKNFLRRLIVDSLLKEYFERERAFQSELVRHLNSSARYIDSRDAELFWQLVQKIDNDVQGLNERTDHLFDEAVAMTSAWRAQLEEQLEQPINTERQETASQSSRADAASPLELLTVGQYLPPQWKETLERINRNTRRLNELLSRSDMESKANALSSSRVTAEG